jgi:pilus assembly protein CpaF
MINGPYRVFIERRGFLQQEKGISLDEKALMIAVKNIARRLGDDISESKPILDSRLPDGSRSPPSSHRAA